MKAIQFLLVLLSVPYYLIYGFIKRVKKYPGNFPKSHTWYRMKLKGCISSDGSSYSIYLKKGSINKTVVFFSGGGASWDEYTAVNPTKIGRLLLGKESYYFPFVRYYLELMMKGILAADDNRNPCNDWNYIYLPYATGDLHIGNRDFLYTKKGRRKILHHHGSRNVQKALQSVPKDFLTADQVLISGQSAGAFAAAAWGVEVTKYFPNCNLFVLYSDGGQIWTPRWKDILTKVWNTDKAFSECVTEEGQLIRDWFLHFSKELGDRGTLLYSISPYDGILSSYENKLRGSAYEITAEGLENFSNNLQKSIRALKEKVPGFYYYQYTHEKDQKGATAHTIVCTPQHFYDDREGLSVAGWLKKILEGESVEREIKRSY